jgi:hypothetical protein
MEVGRLDVKMLLDTSDAQPRHPWLAILRLMLELALVGAVIALAIVR